MASSTLHLEVNIFVFSYKGSDWTLLANTLLIGTISALVDGLLVII